MGANLPTWHWKKAVTKAMMMPSAAMTTNMPQGSRHRRHRHNQNFRRFCFLMFLVWRKRIRSSRCHKRHNVMQTHTSDLYLYFYVQICTLCLGKIQDFASTKLLCPDHTRKNCRYIWHEILRLCNSLPVPSLPNQVQSEWPYGLVTAWNKANDVAREVISHTRKKKTMRKLPLKPWNFTIQRPVPRRPPLKSW